MAINELTTFFGWCSILNITLLTLSAVLLILFKEHIAKIHAWMFAIDPVEIQKMYFQYLANYKIAILILNIIPYISLKIMT